MVTDLRFTMMHERFPDPTIRKCSCVIDAWLQDCGSASKALKSILAWVLICSERFWACLKRENEGSKTGLRVPHISMLLTELFTNYWWKICIKTVNVVEVTLNVEILGALGSALRPSFVRFQQGQNCAKRSRIHQLMVKNRVKTVNIGKGHLKRRNITRSSTRFNALICAVLTSPQSYKTVQNSWINGEKSM